MTYLGAARRLFGVMGLIADYFNWATSLGGAVALALFVVVVPAVALLVVATVLVWVLAGFKFVGRAFLDGFHRAS